MNSNDFLFDLMCDSSNCNSNSDFIVCLYTQVHENHRIALARILRLVI